MFGLVSWFAFGVFAVSSTGSVQYANELAGSVVLKLPPGPSVLYAW